MNVKRIRILSVIFSCFITGMAPGSDMRHSQALLKQVLLKDIARKFDDKSDLESLNQDTEAEVLKLKPNRASQGPWSHLSKLTITQLGLSTDVEKNEGHMLREFTDYELKQKEVSVNKNGSLMFMTESGFGLRLSSDETYIWVMLATGEIFATKELEEDSSETGVRKVHHSALLKGREKLRGPVASGSLKVFSNGKIRIADEKSGHYAPRGRIKYLLEELEARLGSRAFLTTHSKIKVYDDEDSLSRVDLTRYSESDLTEVMQKAWGS